MFDGIFVSLSDHSLDKQHSISTANIHWAEVKVSPLT